MGKVSAAKHVGSFVRIFLCCVHWPKQTYRVLDDVNIIILPALILIHVP